MLVLISTTSYTMPYLVIARPPPFETPRRIVKVGIGGQGFSISVEMKGKFTAEGDKTKGYGMIA